MIHILPSRALDYLKSGKQTFTNIQISDGNYVGLNLYNKYFMNVILLRCRFIKCNFADSQFRECDFDGSSFPGCSFDNVKFYNNDNFPQSLDEQLTIVPEGDLIVYKKASTINNYNALITLLIPKNAKRCSATGRKCRAEYAKVLKIESMRSKRQIKLAYSEHSPNFEYRVGKIVRPHYSFEENRWIECTSGIHFYLTRGEAERH
jgi:hypothetical protein